MLERNSAEFTAIQNTLRQTLMLENARPLYDGIVDLRAQLIAAGGAEFKDMLHALCLRESDKQFESVQKKVEELLEAAYIDTDTLIRQSPNFALLSFWEKYFGTSPLKKEAVSAITDMLLYHDLLHTIHETQSPETTKKTGYDDLPYLYENLCNCIMKLMQCRNSYIVHHVSCGDTHIVARSAYLPEEVEDAAELKASDIAGFLTENHSKTPDMEEGFCEKPVFSLMGADGYNYWLLRLYESGDEQLYLLLQYEAALPDTRELVKILFARDHLKSAVFRDFEHLLNLRYELGFVRFFRERTADKPPYPIIMHTSDLHADTVFPADKCLQSVLDSLSPGDGVDLLVLSGDIVDGKNSNASQTQKNYDYAAETIRKLVSKIWSCAGRISFDWKRRILFVPGNHDFAAMNLVKAVLKQRALAAGLPYDGNNKVVAKFAYYLNFILELLDVPIDLLIRDEINEVREYRRMNTKVLMLNSSYDASYMRTNKVRISKTIVERLTGSEAWKECPHSERALRICVVHHPPSEPIDYTLDGYDEVPGWEWGKDADKAPMNTLYRTMKAAVNSVKYDAGKMSFDDMAVKLFKGEYDKCKESVAENNLKGNQENKLYFTKDATLLFKYFTDKENAECAEKLISDIQFNERIAAQDQKELLDCIGACSDVDIILCGHVHETKDMPEISLSDPCRSASLSIVGKLLVKDDNWERKAHIDIRMIQAKKEKGEIKVYPIDQKVTPTS